ncbi:hypothetical protein ACHHYP_17522, partial [Achlya hypogyna]
MSPKTAFVEARPPSSLLPVVPSRRWAHMLEVAGIVYVVGSIALSVYALQLFYTYLATDFFWPDFATSAPVVAAMFNNVLTLKGAGNPDLLSPAMALAPSLAGINTGYPRKVMYSELTTLVSAVRGLRQLSTSKVVKMVTPYCWADLKKRWEMAYTVKRQARCWRHDATNGAVHLETVLRNIKFRAWLDNTQGKFASAIGTPIATSSTAGAAWLAALTAHVWSPESEEVDLWTAHGLDHFTLQYGTGIGIGCAESIQIENALGVRLTLPLKEIVTTNRWTFRTTG